LAKGQKLRQLNSAIRLAAFLSLLSACATQPTTKQIEWKPTQGELYFSDGNRAPASMGPPQVSGDESGIVVDAAHLRSQGDYHFTMAEAYSLEGDVMKAIEEYKLTLVYDPNSSVVHVKLGSEYIKKGLISEATKHAEQAVALDPKNFEARFLAGGLYSSMKLYDQARKQYSAVIELDAQNTEAYLYLGALHAEEGQYEEAVKVFQKVAAIKSNTSPHLAYYYIGRIRTEMKDFEKAKVAFETSLSLKPDFVESILGLGVTLEKMSQRSGAQKLYASFQAKFGPNERVAEVLAKMFLEDEEFDKAYQQYDVVAKKDPDNLNSRVKMALILIDRKDYTRAIEKLREILVLAPDSDKIRFYLGAVYEELKDYPAAIDSFSRLQISSVFYEESVLHTSYMYKLLNDYDKALETLEAGVKNRPDVPQFYALWASLLDDQKRHKEAIAMLGQAVKRFPQSDQLWFFLGSIQDKVADRTSMVVSMKTVLELNPDHVQALNYLAYSLAEMNTDLDKALAMAEKAVALQPRDAYIRDTHGWVLYRMGRFEDAVKILELAHKTKPEESIIAEHLGDAYYQVQAVTKARSMYERALALEKDDGNKSKLRAKLDSMQRDRSVESRIPASTP
jgi:tetratricopeptide (TPR) repeat protein